MSAQGNDLVTINDAAGIMTPKRNGGHVKWPNDHERQVVLPRMQ